MSDSKRKLAAQDRTADRAVAQFIDDLKKAPIVRSVARRGRLLFVLDATMSREPTWKAACKIQSEMFLEAGKVGGLLVQVACFRGEGEFYASPWLADADSLAGAMTEVECRSGRTQLCRVLRHALEEGSREPIDAMVYVGDCFEEGAGEATRLAGQIALHGTPIFVFHEGGQLAAVQVFHELARVTRGAYCPFDTSSAKQLAELLRAVAVYATGGRRALARHASREGGQALLIARQMEE